MGITEVISNVLPSQKSETIKMLKEKGNKVMMCGDGIMIAQHWQMLILV